MKKLLIIFVSLSFLILSNFSYSLHPLLESGIFKIAGGTFAGLTAVYMGTVVYIANQVCNNIEPCDLPKAREACNSSYAMAATIPVFATAGYYAIKDGFHDISLWRNAPPPPLPHIQLDSALG